MKPLTFISSAVAAASLAFSAEATPPAPPTPENHPVMLAFQFQQANGAAIFGRNDYKTSKECDFGAHKKYAEFLKKNGAKESQMSGGYFCTDAKEGIVSVGYVTQEKLGRPVDFEKKFPEIKHLVPLTNFGGLKFDPAN